MTIGGWISFAILALLFLGAGVFAIVVCETVAGKILGAVVSVLLTVILLVGCSGILATPRAGSAPLWIKKAD